MTATNTLQGCHSIDYETASLRIYIIALRHVWPAQYSPATVTLSFVKCHDLVRSLNI